MLALIRSLLLKYLPHGIVGAVMLGLLTFGYHVWHDHVYNEALVEFNQAQAKQLAADDAKYHEILLQLKAAQDTIAKGEAAYRKSLESTAESVRKNLVTSQNRPASDLLKKAVSRVREMK